MGDARAARGTFGSERFSRISRDVAGLWRGFLVPPAPAAGDEDEGHAAGAPCGRLPRDAAFGWEAPGAVDPDPAGAVPLPVAWRPDEIVGCHDARARGGL